jgi:acetyltransferase-like isoleucine patch superfamily enzyme
MVKKSHPSFRLSWRPGVLVRITWMVVSVIVVETFVLGLSAVPGALLLERLSRVPTQSLILSTFIVCLGVVPAYALFAIGLMALSAFSTWLLGWRTPPDTEMVVADVGRPLCNWACYGISSHVVRLLAGSVLKATPVWSFYLRMNGAKLGRGVYVNSLHLTDHNLLEFDDYVVIGDGVHLSGHTVERGVIKTGRVRLGRSVIVGLDSIVGIGVEAGPNCQIGALSLVPKYSKLEEGATYVGRPVSRVDRRDGNGMSELRA